MPLGLDGPALWVMGWGCGGAGGGAEVASWPGAARTAAAAALGLATAAFGMVWLCLWRLPWRWLGVPMLVLGLMSPMLHRAPDCSSRVMHG